MANDKPIRDRLKAVREDIADARSRKAAARTEQDAAKEAFTNANHDGPVTEWPEFGAAQEAVAKVGQIADEIADLQVAEAGLLRMLGDDAPVEAVREAAGRAARQDGHALLAAGSSYAAAVEKGVFSSSNAFGTVSFGQIASREEALSFLAVGNAPAGPVTSGGASQLIEPDQRGMQPLNLRPLRFLDLVPTGTTDSNSIEYVQVQSIPSTSGMVAEGAVKPEVGLGLGDAVAPVRTVAGWIKVNRQAMDDAAGLATLINTLLPYDVRRKIENQVLAGDGTGQNLKGILNQTGLGAPSYVAGDNPADAILRAMTVVILSDADPNFVAAHPLLWQDILLMRESGSAGTRSGQYLAGGPFAFTAPTLWGLALTPSTVIPQDTPLVGDANGVTLLFREGVNVKTSDSDQDDFVRNRVTILAEARVAAPVWRPASFAIADTTA